MIKFLNISRYTSCLRARQLLIDRNWGIWPEFHFAVCREMWYERVNQERTVQTKEENGENNDCYLVS